jgi:hypothetical protein
LNHFTNLLSASFSQSAATAPDADWSLSILVTDWELQHFYQTDWDVKNNVGEKNL